jgi:2-methylcitrate dehydratase PrpD
VAKTAELAEFVNGITYAEMPPAVVEKAKEIILHSLGVQLAGSTLPWSKLVYRHVRECAGAPQATIVNYGRRVSVLDAAYANGVFGHSFELDDNHSKTGVKGGCVAVPTALALGEWLVSSGRDVVAAVVAGFEVMLRVGLAARPGIVRRGGHPTGTCGVFGAAAVASRLLGLDPSATMYALGSAGTNIIGLSEIPRDGRGHLKRTFGGAAAAAGMRAAMLASAGLTGPETTLAPDTSWGSFARVFDIDESRAPLLTAGLGSEWKILEVHYKIYAQDGFIQPMTDALAEIRRHASFDAQDVAEVVVGTNSHAHDRVIGTIREPRDLTDAQFSANFSVALFLVRGGAGFSEYTDDALTDPQIKDLSQRVRIEVDEEMDRAFAISSQRGAKVTVRLKSGQEFAAVVDNLRALSSVEVDEKFRQLSEVVLAPTQADLLRTSVRTLDELPDVSNIVRLLARHDVVA